MSDRGTDAWLLALTISVLGLWVAVFGLAVIVGGK